MKRWILFSLMSAAAAVASSGELSLRAAVETAVAGNPAVRAASIRAEAAVERHRQVRSFRLPSVDLLASYGATNVPAEAFALQLNQRRFDMQEFFSADPNRPDLLSSFVTRLDITMPLYTGGELSSRIGQAGDMASAGRTEYDFALEKTAHDTIVSYVNLTKAREYLGLARRSQDTTEAHVELAKDYAAQGLILDADVLQAEVHLKELQEMVAQAASGARLAEAALNFHMGGQLGNALDLGELPPNPPVAGELELWLERALDERRDLRTARLSLDAGRKEVDVRRAAFKPEVALMGSYGVYDDDFLGTDGHSGSIMAVARINLFRGGADEAAVTAAARDLASGEADVERFESGIALEVEQSWQDLATARIRHEAATASVAAAEEALRVREQRFKQGLDRMIDLVDAETAAHGSRLRELVARYDLALATYTLYFKSGTSLLAAVGVPDTGLTDFAQKGNDQ